MNKCPSCGRGLRIGKDSPLKIEYPPEKLQEFAAGLLSIEQLNEHAIFYYMRDCVCPSQSIPELDGKPCPQFGKVVETIKIIDK